MNNEHVKGTLNHVKGRVKEEVGHATGNHSMAGEGVIERVKGKIQQGMGDLKDAIKKGVDTVLSHDKKKAS